MKYQQVSVDIWKMLATACTYLAMALGVWILLRLVSACFWLPGHLQKQREEDEEKKEPEETAESEPAISEPAADEPETKKDQ